MEEKESNQDDPVVPNNPAAGAATNGNSYLTVFPFHRLPVELKEVVLLRLSSINLRNVALVCSEWKALIEGHKDLRTRYSGFGTLASYVNPHPKFELSHLQHPHLVLENIPYPFTHSAQGLLPTRMKIQGLKWETEKRLPFESFFYPLPCEWYKSVRELILWNAYEDTCSIRASHVDFGDGGLKLRYVTDFMKQFPCLDVLELENCSFGLKEDGIERLVESMSKIRILRINPDYKLKTEGDLFRIIKQKASFLGLRTIELDTLLWKMDPQVIMDFLMTSRLDMKFTLYLKIREVPSDRLKELSELIVEKATAVESMEIFECPAQGNVLQTYFTLKDTEVYLRISGKTEEQLKKSTPLAACTSDEGGSRRILPRGPPRGGPPNKRTRRLAGEEHKEFLRVYVQQQQNPGPEA